MNNATDEEAPVGIEAAIRSLLALTDETIEAARQGQVVETDLLTMRIGIMSEALRHADRSEAAIWMPRLNDLAARLGELSGVLDNQETKLKGSMTARARRALDAYR